MTLPEGALPEGSFPEGGVYCTGNIVLDILVRPLEALPEWGTTTWVDSIEQHLGGNGAITSYALGKLGAPVRLAGMVGDDASGEYVLGRLGSAGVDLSEVGVAPGAQTATTVGIINQGCERLFLHVRGASDLVEPDQFRFNAERLTGFSYFHLGSLFHLPRVRAAGRTLLERARQAGLVTSFDTMWDTTGRWMADIGPLCPLIDLLFVNQDEARMLAGSAEPAEVGPFFRRHGAGIVVLKMGASGCAVSAPGEEFVAPAFPVEAVDSTGAGDSFCAGFLAALRRGFSLREAARLANAVAAHSISRIGGTEGLADFDQTVAWMARGRTT
jgi:sugar/nucleoside kinase (ribokinase family)